MSGFFRRKVFLRANELKSRYDVAIIGGGGHGLAIAYYLAKRHGIRDVAVFERAYIGAGGSGRNTTVLRANYMTPATIPLYKASFDLYCNLSQALDYNMLRSQRGLMWMAHSEGGLHSQKERTFLNQDFGVDTIFLTPQEVKEVCPVMDITGGGRWPVLGAAHHPPGSIIRHDAVVWGFASAAQRLGVHVHQGLEVTGVTRQNGRCVGIETPKGKVAAGAVVSAVGGYVSTVTRMAGIRLPITTHPLQAYVTESYKPVLDRIVASQDLHFYVSQSARGELLVGAELDPYASYSTRSTFPFLSSASSRCIDLFPFMAKLRILRQWTGVCDMTPDYSPIIGRTELENFFVDTGLGTWGFKLTPISGVTLAELVATGRVPDLIAPFAATRFRNDRAISERKSAGTH